jgi:hypothetical protein
MSDYFTETAEERRKRHEARSGAMRICAISPGPGWPTRLSAPVRTPEPLPGRGSSPHGHSTGRSRT